MPTESPAFPPRPLRWLYLDLNSYFASVEQQLDPRLRGRPVIVAPVDTDSTVAIAASVEAKRYGIRTGTPVWEARRLCRDLVVTPARHDRYVEFHHAIIAEIWRHIPVHAVCSIDEVACRLLDNENSRDRAIALGERIKAGIRANVGDRLTSSVGIAPNRLLAKLASDMEKPDGMTVLDAAGLPDRLFGLSLRDIAGIGVRMERRLARAGINDIAQLCERTPAKVGAAWGSRDGDRLWFLLHGVDLPDIATRTRTVGHSHVLAPADRHSAAARPVLRRLTMKAGSRLRRKGYAARGVLLHVRFEHDRGRWKAALPLASTQDSFAILAAIDRLWPQMERDCGGRPGGIHLRQIGMVLFNLVPQAGEQGELFDAPGHASPGDRGARRLALACAIDRINERFGRNAATLGMVGTGRAARLGTHIAFGRIPEAAEFHE